MFSRWGEINASDNLQDGDGHCRVHHVVHAAVCDACQFRQPAWAQNSGGAGQLRYARCSARRISCLFAGARCGGASVDLSAAAPIDILALARGFPAETQRPNFGIPTALPVALPPLPGRGHASAHQTNSNPPSPVPAALFSLPHQLEANVDRVSFGGPVLAPMAFVRFCIRYPQDCKVHRMAFRPVPVTLTKARKAELVKVNRDVNRAIRPQENLNGVMAEEWLVAPREGDCNDYAVTKRHELLARGWPSRSLMLAEVVVPSGEHHLVLVVRTREDDVVLDSLSWTVRPVSQIHYQWVRAQQAKNPKFWSMINVTRATRVAMNTR
jgi:predicted transglutaminase-like cysteine proteinase